MEACSHRRSGRTPVAAQVARDRHVLSVAERLFLEKGYHQVSLALVASSAGVATRTIYARFGEKRALLEEIIECRRDASEMALTTIGGEHLAPGRDLHRIAAHAFEHELLPCLELLHADLVADRETHAPAPRRWAEEGRWRTLLEQSLAPAPSCVADVFVACLMREQHHMRSMFAGKELSAEVIDGMARRVVERFLEQIKALNAHIDGLFERPGKNGKRSELAAP
jgi:AcrR family transcriptional regulator